MKATKTATVKRLPARAETEAQFEASVIELAKHCGWIAYHTRISVQSAEGYPDLTLTKGGRLIFAELKSERGKVRPDQLVWLATLAQCPGVEVALWRPSQWDVIVAALLHGAPVPAYTERPELLPTAAGRPADTRNRQPQLESTPSDSPRRAHASTPGQGETAQP